MTAYRIEKQNNYTVVDNAFVKDNRISFKAKGILLYLLSRPDNWNVYESDIVKQSNDGIWAVRSGVRELIEAGYIERQKKRDGLGRISGYEYVVHEQSPLLGFPKTDNPKTGNSTLLSTGTTNYGYNQHNIKKDDTSGIAKSDFSNVEYPSFDKQINIFNAMSETYGYDRALNMLSVVDWYIDTAYPACMRKKHPKESKAKRMCFAEKLLSCADTTGTKDNIIAATIERAINNFKDCNPTIYWVTTPAVLGYWLIQDEEISYDSVNQTEYAPVEAAY